MKLLSIGTSNAKTSKNSRPTAILYLSAYTQNSKGINICPMASQGCAAACLVTAGRGAFSNVHNARVRKTDLYLSDRFEFVRQLTADILEAYKKGIKTFRLNGTSDLPFHKMLNWASLPSDIEVYDYTKIPEKAGYHTLAGGQRYVVTFSRSEVNEAEAIAILKAGGNVAAVFEALPDTWQGFPVIDGDLADDLMLDHTNVVIGLKAKGKAKKDTTGFVIKH